jgi:membrane-associated phospholipid phosphatase
MVLMLFFWNRARLLRPLLVAYPVAMGLVLMYAGEHYLFDVLAGWSVAALVVTLCNKYERRGLSGSRNTKRAGLVAAHGADVDIPAMSGRTQ